jgi:hypothetical protein
MVGHGHIHLPIIIIRHSIIKEVDRAVFPPLSVQVIAVETAKMVGVVEFTKIVV